MDLLRQHLDYNRRHRQQLQPGPQKRSNTQEVIYRKADDSWF